MKALGATNVETIIVFRACTPITVAVIEWAFMDRELPSQKSSFALAVIVGGVRPATLDRLLWTGSFTHSSALRQP